MRYPTPAVRIGLIGSIVAAQLVSAAPVEADAPRGDGLPGLTMAILLVIFLTVGVVSVCNCYALLRPESVRAKSRDLLAAPGKAFALGILASVVATLYFAATSALPKPLADVGGMLGLVVVAILTLTGLCGVCHALGNRLLNSLASEKASYDIWRITAGAVLIMSCNFFPIVGQIITAVALISAFGVSVHQIMRRKHKASLPEPDASTSVEETTGPGN